MLPWHLKITVKRERDFLKKGGKLIFPPRNRNSLN